MSIFKRYQLDLGRTLGKNSFFLIPPENTGYAHSFPQARKRTGYQKAEASPCRWPSVFLTRLLRKALSYFLIRAKNYSEQGGLRFCWHWGGLVSQKEDDCSLFFQQPWVEAELSPHTAAGRRQCQGKGDMAEHPACTHPHPIPHG